MRQLRYFVEVVEAGSYTLAAERLFIAQSALSRHIKELEEAMKVQLLIRDSKPLRMTPSGEAFYAGAKQALAVVNETVSQSRQAAQGELGTIRLLHSSSVPLGSRLMDSIRHYLHANPGISLDVSQMSSEHQGIEVEEGRADVGLVRLPTHRKFPGLEVVELFSEPLMLAVAAPHPLSGRMEVAVAELRDEPFVSMPHWARGGLSYRVTEMCSKNGFVPRPARATSRKTTLLSLIEAGFGVGIVPESMRAIAPAGVRLVRLSGQECESTVALVHRKEVSALVGKFVAALRFPDGGIAF
jgi:DNA-binding transcriptional LysR family regulator